MTIVSDGKGQLKSLVERIERLEEEKAALAADIRQVYAEAKGSGFDTKILRKVIRLRKVDRAEREEEEALLDTYMAALGMLPLEAVATGDSPALRRAARQFVDDLPANTTMTMSAGDNSLTIVKDKAGKVTRADVDARH